VDGKISPLKELNGHGKDGSEPLVDFLSLGSSKESGGQPITDDTDQFCDGMRLEPKRFIFSCEDY